MKEEKLIKVLKQLTVLSNLQAEKNKMFDERINLLKEMSDIQNKTILKFSDNLNERIKTIENENLTKSARIT